MHSAHAGFSAVKGVKHVVFWTHPADSNGTSIKINLIVYDNDILLVQRCVATAGLLQPQRYLLQVSGTSYFLWTLEHYAGLCRVVDDLMGSDSRAATVTTVDEVGFEFEHEEGTTCDLMQTDCCNVNKIIGYLKVCSILFIIL